eukprot:8084504-Pyramimonas_sp.AAC.1
MGCRRKSRRAQARAGAWDCRTRFAPCFPSHVPPFRPTVFKAEEFFGFTFSSLPLAAGLLVTSFRANLFRVGIGLAPASVWLDAFSF